MKYKLIASDLDGTLLNDNSEISENTKAAILKATDNGVLFVAATGRAMSGVEHINALLKEDMPFITINGAVVIMGKSRKILVNKNLNFNLAKEIFNIGVNRDIPVIVWTLHRLWASRDCNETMLYKKVAGTDMEIINDLDEINGEEGISKVLWIDAPDKISRFHLEMNERYGDKLNCFPSRPVFLDFVSPDADKATAMEEIGRIYGIDRSEMIAIGDGYNDISMLKYAGLGVAMKNAPDAVKAACGYVTDTNNEDGAAAVIEKFIFPLI
jgi:Cof subfamily protein (haloacid dehalogenase superfamily)